MSLIVDKMLLIVAKMLFTKLLNFFCMSSKYQTLTDPQRNKKKSLR
jgi:hypothetical protein